MGLIGNFFSRSAALTETAIARALVAQGLTDAQGRAAIGGAASVAAGLRAIGLTVVADTPAVTPTLTLTGPLTYTATPADAGRLVANIGNVPAGVTPTLTPNDGRMVIAGDATAGWKVVTGLTASTASATPIALAVAAAGANGASAPVVVTAIVAYDTDAAALFARSASPYSNAEKTAYNDMIVGLKADGLWPLINALHVAGGDETKVLLNIKGGADATATGLWSAVGNDRIIGDGSTARITLGVNVGTQNDASVAIWPLSDFRGDSTNPAETGNDNVAIIARSNGDMLTARLNGPSVSVANTDARGFFFASRTNASQLAIYRNGTLVVNGASVSTAPSASPIWAMGRNNTTVQYSPRESFLYMVGKGFSAAQAAQLYDRLNTFRLALRAIAAAPARTPATNALLTYLRGRIGTPAYVIGAVDRRWSNVQVTNSWDIFTSITGKTAGIRVMEYVDPLRPAGGTMTNNGATDSPLQIATARAHIEAGGIVTLHCHSGNPVVGSLQTFLGSNGNTTRNTFGNPVQNCLPGGSKRAEWVAFVNRLAGVLSAISYPVILRMFHEMTGGGFFWWNQNIERIHLVRLQRDMISQLRAAGINNVLYDFNTNDADRSNLNTGPGWYPGAGYADIVSLDDYDIASPPTGLSVVGVVSNVRRVDDTKISGFSEMGYPNGSTVSDIWKTKTGDVMKSSFTDFAYLNVWSNPEGPDVGTAATQSFADMVADTACLTLDRLAGVYA